MSRCEAWWVRCERTARKVAVFENHFKEETRLWLCDDHIVEFADPEFRHKALDRALDTGSTPPQTSTESVAMWSSTPARPASS